MSRIVLTVPGTDMPVLRYGADRSRGPAARALSAQRRAQRASKAAEQRTPLASRAAELSASPFPLGRL